jgi:hypothetical protein
MRARVEVRIYGKKQYYTFTVRRSWEGYEYERDGKELLIPNDMLIDLISEDLDVPHGYIRVERSPLIVK